MKTPVYRTLEEEFINIWSGDRLREIVLHVHIWDRGSANGGYSRAVEQISLLGITNLSNNAHSHY